MNLIPRLRIFAGPNGSGKSTIQSVLNHDLLGFYINPDEIEKQIKLGNFLDLHQFGIQASSEEVMHFFGESVLLKKAGLDQQVNLLSYSDGRLAFKSLLVNSYWASVVADFIRQQLLKQRQSFTFETVMSSSDKVAFLQQAQQQGYRTYLYYVATQDPLINISRVRHRVNEGGHDVPKDKIISRYHRSLDLLLNAIQFTNRAYIFDNSGSQRIWLAEITDGSVLEIKSNSIPAWFKNSILTKI